MIRIEVIKKFDLFWSFHRQELGNYKRCLKEKHYILWGTLRHDLRLPQGSIANNYTLPRFDIKFMTI
jgi:hypothetical protein